MNTGTFSDDMSSAEVNSLSRAIDLLNIYDPCSFIDAMQAVRFKNTFRSRYGLPLESEDAFWKEVVSSLQDSNIKTKE